MHVACSTQCFSRLSLQEALETIAELEFHKLDLAIIEKSNHLRPSQVAENVAAVAAMIRSEHSLSPAAITLEIAADDPTEYLRQFTAVCQLARLIRAPLVTIAAASSSSPVETEVVRLTKLNQIAEKDGITLSLATRQGTLTETPETAVELCERVPGLVLTLDPSHYVANQASVKSYDQVYPYVRHVHLRDTGRGPNQFQVHVGQGEIEYSRVIAQLERCQYNRLLTVDIHDQALECEKNPEVRKLKFLLESLV